MPKLKLFSTFLQLGNPFIFPMAGASNDTGHFLVGGRFKIQQDTYFVGVKPYAPTPPFKTLACTFYNDTILLDVTQTFVDSFYASYKDGSTGVAILETDSTGAPTSATKHLPNGAIIEQLRRPLPNVVFIDVSPSTINSPTKFGSGAGIPGYIRIYGAPLQYYWLFQINPPINPPMATLVYDGSTFIGTVAKASAPLLLKPENEYALVTMVGSEQIPYPTTGLASSHATVNFTPGNALFKEYKALISSPHAFEAEASTVFLKGYCMQFPGNITGSIHLGDWAISPGVIPVGAQVIFYEYLQNQNSTEVYVNRDIANTINYTVKFWNPSAIQQTFVNAHTLLKPEVDQGNTGWNMDVHIDAGPIVTDVYDIPPPPTVSQGITTSTDNTTTPPTVTSVPNIASGNVTITIPTALLPSDFLSFDLQYAKSTDNYTWGPWKDIGTFPAVTTSDATEHNITNLVGQAVHQPPDPSTTDPSDIRPTVFYIYRYRLRTKNDAETEWSYPGYAGQINNPPSSS